MLKVFFTHAWQCKELTAVLRSMGQNPTDSQVNDMINEVRQKGGDMIYLILDTRLMMKELVLLSLESS